MPNTTVRGIEIYFERNHSEAGAPRLLFINGSGGDLRQKPGVFEGPLACHFDMLAYDQRGLGQSEIPDGPYSMADYAEDAAGLLDAVGWDRCAVIGVSFGGMVAQELAVRHPERIERMVLCCTSPGGAGGHSYPLHELQALPESERAEKSLELADRRMDADWRQANPDSFERMFAMFASRAVVGAREPRRELGQRLQFEARAGLDTYDRLPKLTMPVLCCGGRYDGLAPPENMEAIRDRIPGARLELFEGGHLFMMQDREAYPKILEFLLENEPENDSECGSDNGLKNGERSK